ncbi:hypothetical protein G6F57_023499 [Rhizopus arrhizus]|nr:hypothetical protein G6F57_023499 [Rhizopus arrhizus]
MAASGLPLSLKRCDRAPLASTATRLSLASMAWRSAAPNRRLASSACHAHQAATDTTLKRPSPFMYRIGTNVPYSSSRLSISCERVPTPASLAHSAMRRPSSGLPR